MIKAGEYLIAVSVVVAMATWLANGIEHALEIRADIACRRVWMPWSFKRVVVASAGCAAVGALLIVFGA